MRKNRGNSRHSATSLSDGEQIISQPFSAGPQGKLVALIAMVEFGKDDADVVTQLSAVSSALDKAGFAIIAAAMRECMAEDSVDDEGKPKVEDLEKLFLSLS
jgi:Uncharacterized protein conserved in bacteria